MRSAMRIGAERGEFVVEVYAELAEVLVVRIAQRKDGVEEFSAMQGRVFEAELLVEGLDGIGRVAFAVGAGDEDGVTLLQ